MTQATVFLSYSHRQFYAAEYLARVLEQNGLSAWLDVQEILPGADWQASIDQGLAACTALVVVASRAAYRSAAVQYEVAAVRAAGKPIILAVIEDNPFVRELAAVATVIDCRLEFSSSVIAIAQALKDGKPLQAIYRRSKPLATLLHALRYVAAQTGKYPEAVYWRRTHMGAHAQAAQTGIQQQARYQRGTPFGWFLPFGRLKYLQLVLLNLCFLLGTGTILLRKQIVIHGPLNTRLLPYLVLATIPVILWGLSFVYSLLLLVAFRRQARVAYLALELWPALQVFAFPALFGTLDFSSATTDFGSYFNAYLAITDRVTGDTLSWQLWLSLSAWTVYLIFVSLTLRGWLLASGWLLLLFVLQSPLVPSLARPLVLLAVGAGIAFLGMRSFLSGRDVPIAFGEHVLEYHLPESLGKPWKPVTRKKVLRINEDRAWGRWLTPGAFPNEAYVRVYQHARDQQPAPDDVKTWRLHYVPADARCAKDVRRVFAEYTALREATAEEPDEQIAILSNKTPRRWIDVLATRYPRLICIIVSSVESSALDDTLRQHQWIDYRQQRPYQIHNLARSLSGMASTINPTTPENFVRPVGPHPVRLVVHALRMGGTASVVLGVAAQLIATYERVVVAPLPVIVASIALGIWAWWEAGRLLARNAFLPEVLLTFSAVLITLGYWVVSGSAIMLLPREVWVHNGSYNDALTTGLAFVAAFVVVPFLFILLVATFELVRGSETLHRWLPRYMWPTWQRTLAVAPWRRLNFSSVYYAVAAIILIAMAVIDSPYRYPHVHEYDVAGAPILLAGPDGNAWFALSSTAAFRIGYISPAGTVLEQQVAIPQPRECLTDSFHCLDVGGLRFGPDHQLWYEAMQTFPPYTPEIRRSALIGATTRFHLPPHAHTDYLTTSFVFDDTGKLWYARAEFSLHPTQPGWIGRLDPAASDGSITEFELPASSSPTAMVAGPDGNIWFFDDGLHQAIGKITPQGVVTEYPLPYGSDVAGVGRKELIAGPDHNLWFADPQFGVVGRVTTSGVITLFASENSFPTHLVIGPDGEIWFLDKDKIAIGHITAGDQLKVYPLHARLDVNASLTAGPDGNLWVTLYNQVGRMTPEGTLTLYDVPTLDARLESIMAGANHHLWFAEYAGLIGELSP